MKRGLLAALSLFAGVQNVSASAVAWDCLIACNDLAGRVDVIEKDGSPTMEFGFRPTLIFDIHTDASRYWLVTRDLEDTLSSFIGNWLVAQKGDIVDSASTRHVGSYLNHAKIDDETGYTQYSLDGVAPSDYYLMFVVEDIDDYNSSVLTPRFAYGWVHLLVNDDMSLMIESSAMGLEGQPMVVGEGAIPEPTTGSLIAMGLALLAFRRRVVWQPRLNFRAKI